MLGDGSERRQDRHGLELDDLSHAAARIGIAVQIDGGRVCQKEKVELAPLRELGHLDHVGEARPRMIVGVRMSPRSDVLSSLVHEGTEMHHALGLSHASLPTAVCRQRGLSRKFRAAGSG